MAIEDDQNQDESGKKEPESFTKEQVESLIKERLETAIEAATVDLKKEYQGIQSGLQRKVNEAEESARQKELEGKTVEEQLMARVGALEETNTESASDLHHERMKAKGREILDEASIKPPTYFDRLIGKDEEETVKLVTDFVEEQQGRDAERNKEYDRNHGRIVGGGTADAPDAWAKLGELTEQQLQALGPKEVVRLTREALDKAVS